MKIEPNQKLKGHRVASGETGTDTAKHATERKIAIALHGAGHYDSAHVGLAKSAKKHALPALRQKP